MQAIPRTAPVDEAVKILSLLKPTSQSEKLRIAYCTRKNLSLCVRDRLYLL